MFNKKNKKIKEYEDLIVALKRQNDTLKQEIIRLQNQNEFAIMYKKQYKQLAEQSKQTIEKYKIQLEKMQELETEYRKYLDKIKRK